MSDNGWQGAGVAAWHAWVQLANAKTLPQQADALNALGNAMAGLSTWLPRETADDDVPPPRFITIEDFA